MRATRTVRLLAIVWLLLVVAFALHNLWLWTGGHLKLETDVLAMLPQDEREPAINQATRHLTEAASRRVVVLVGGHDEAAALQAGDAYEASVAASIRQAGQGDLQLSLRYRVSESGLDEWLDFFTPYRKGLLTREQRQMLETQTPQALADRAIEALYRPLGMPRIGAWHDDPLNLFSGWLTARASESRVRISHGRLVLNSSGQYYAVLMLEQQAQGFSLTAQKNLIPVLDRARAAVTSGATAIPATEVLAIGVPFYTVAAATQAEREVHTIGLGSLAGIVLLTLFAFSAIRPRILVTLSIGIGLLAAISACALLFERVHLLTLVFGAGLVGVAENYGTNYFTSRLGRPPEERWIMLREQAPVMALALLTTVIGYVALALTPFPGLRQMAVFSVAGLVSAFVTVLLWFPFLDGGRMDYTRLSRWLGSRRATWPVFGRNRFTLLFGMVVMVLLLAGAWRLYTNDDIRLLQNAPSDLVAQQLQVNRLLDLPGATQFYLVRGADTETVLLREEALKTQLDVLADAGVLSGYQAVSDWVPSHARQAANAALVQQMVAGEQGVLARVAGRLGETLTISNKESATDLNIDDWLAAPVSEPLRAQWLGRLDQGDYASVILLRGVDTPTKLTHLAALAGTVPGVRWVDKVAEVSALMARYRGLMGVVIASSYLLVFAALWLRYRRQAWRALLPTLLASALALALLALLGQPLQLFNVLALLLILGMGVDYGIFLLQQPEREALRPFLSVTLAAASTLLSFGLLALSATPALRAFGLTMLFGIGLTWLLTPLFMPFSPIIKK